MQTTMRRVGYRLAFVIAIGVAFALLGLRPGQHAFLECENDVPANMHRFDSCPSEFLGTSECHEEWRWGLCEEHHP